MGVLAKIKWKALGEFRATRAKRKTMVTMKRVSMKTPKRISPNNCHCQMMWYVKDGLVNLSHEMHWPEYVWVVPGDGHWRSSPVTMWCIVGMVLDDLNVPACVPKRNWRPKRKQHKVSDEPKFWPMNYDESKRRPVGAWHRMKYKVYDLNLVPKKILIHYPIHKRRY